MTTDQDLEMLKTLGPYGASERRHFDAALSRLEAALREKDERYRREVLEQLGSRDAVIARLTEQLTESQERVAELVLEKAQLENDLRFAQAEVTRGLGVEPRISSLEAENERLREEDEESWQRKYREHNNAVCPHLPGHETHSPPCGAMQAWSAVLYAREAELEHLKRIEEAFIKVRDTFFTPDWYDGKWYVRPVRSEDMSKGIPSPREVLDEARSALTDGQEI